MRISSRSPRRRKSGARKPAITRKRVATRTNIIEAAERLFGLYGIHGASLRQIALEAGSANKGAIAYHFKNLEGLVHAIFEQRLPALDLRRREMLAGAKGNGGVPSVRDLVAILFAPHREQVDHRGRHSYAAFLTGLRRFHQLRGRRKLLRLAPITEQILELLAQNLPDLSPELLSGRLAAVHNMVISAIAWQDTEKEEQRIPFDDLIDMAVAALQASSNSTEPLVASRLQGSVRRP
jgi:AcrR family transcriptional regulator